MIILIAAIAENNTLGKDNQLVWHLPNDFKRFKELTSNHYIIMGRKTFESFPKPLPNRTHVIITRQSDYKAAGCIVADSIENAIALCPKTGDIFVIGGGEIYNLAMPFADVIEITRVHEKFEGDAFFPEINPNEWLLVESEPNSKDEKHAYDYTYETYVRA
ncbi:dihydrofolate reductase [Flavobacterium agrisoli]|uniref:Dihydrofolate reductase n=1 Tax=Flavobacterium agrisoli TaxID=2793066 RepID=A0A934PPQ9_9FLAO|nr:dihydrofolate reductase [Flavobacterium agrisoli]MBK0370654.1 dihydrofolate reductase [Flavobacterium agrisoli]